MGVAVKIAVLSRREGPARRLVARLDELGYAAERLALPPAPAAGWDVLVVDEDWQPREALECLPPGPRLWLACADAPPLSADLSIDRISPAATAQELRLAIACARRTAAPSPPGGADSAALAAIFDNSQVGIMLLTGYRVLARCNQRLADILGYAAPEAMQGLGMRQLHLSAEAFEQFGRDYYENLRNARMLHIEYQLRRCDGTPVWCLLSGKALDTASPPDLGKGVLWVVDDISQIKESERALREQTALFSGGPTMVFRRRLTPGWPVLLCSPNVTQWLGYSAGELMAEGFCFLALLHPEDRQRIADALEDACAAGVDALEQEYRVRHRDGHYCDVYDYIHVLRDEQGAAHSLLGYLLDVTRQRRAEAERLRLERELQHTRKMEALGQLAGGVAHELNNMLAIMLGQAELLGAHLAGSAEAALLGYVSHIQSAGERAKALIREMLTFGRPHERNPQRVALDATVEQALNLSRASLPSSLEIRYRAASGLADVCLDPGELQQVLMNLLVNARDAMSGRGLIQVCIEPFAEPGRQCVACATEIQGDWVEIRVTDSGCGIPEAQRARIFEPFFSTKPVGKGTGLGLAVVQQIIELSGGHLLLDSQPGAGTSFRLLFPALQAATDAQSRPLPLPVTQAIRPRLSGRVLVVDDEPILTLILEEVLSDCGLEVIASNDSREALTLLCAAEQRYDLLITDQTMPGLLGTELAVAAKAAQPQLRIIMCTGHSEDVSAVSAASYGIDLFLTKPATAEEVRRAVHHLMTATRSAV